MPMPWTLVDTGAYWWYLTKLTQKTIIFAVTFLFKLYSRSICILWVHITPARFATIAREYILKISFCPVSNLRTTWFRRWAEMDQIENRNISISTRKKEFKHRFFLLYCETTCLCNRTIWILCSLPTKTHCSSCITISRAYWNNPWSIWIFLRMR